MPVDSTATSEVTAYRWVPGFAQGLVRDLRVRWALEEIGRPYRVRLFDVTKPRPDEYFCEQPFGQDHLSAYVPRHYHPLDCQPRRLPAVEGEAVRMWQAAFSMIVFPCVPHFARVSEGGRTAALGFLDST